MSLFSNESSGTKFPSITVSHAQAQQVTVSADGACRSAPTQAVRVIAHLMASAEKRGDKDEARRYWREMQELIRGVRVEDGAGYFDAEGERIRADMERRA